MKRRLVVLMAVAFLASASYVAPAQANHSWSTYHWARTSNPFTLKLADNVTSTWDAYLVEASNDWSASAVLDTTIVAGSTTARKCAATVGRVEVCNSTYGNNGWLGIAGITLSGGHINSGYVKLNDTYFNTASYNKPEWRRLVTCQEVGHTFGLNHQDENQTNPNLGTCMDYTSNPLGPPSNEHPNTHDFDQLASIYAHADSSTTIGSSAPSSPGKSSRSKVVDVDSHGNGTVTWITWAD